MQVGCEEENREATPIDTEEWIGMEQRGELWRKQNEMWFLSVFLTRIAYLKEIRAS